MSSYRIHLTVFYILILFTVKSRNNKTENMVFGCCDNPNEEMVLKKLSGTNVSQRFHPAAELKNDTRQFQTESSDWRSVIWKVAVVQYNPYIIFNVTNGKVNLQECTLNGILEFLKDSLHIRYELLEVPGNTWGTNVAGEWNGAIGMLIRGEVDMIPFLPITPFTYFGNDIDFSEILGNTAYGMLIAAPRKPSKAFIFLEICQRQVWILISVTTVALSYILHKFICIGVYFETSDYKENRSPSFISCLWSVFRYLLQQGPGHIPSASSARIILVAWGLSILVFTTTYSANLVAFLASVKKELILDPYNPFISFAYHDSLSLTIKEDCPVIEDFEFSPNGLYRQIKEAYLLDPNRIHMLVKEEDLNSTLENVAAGKTVYIDDINFLRELMQHTEYKCKVFRPWSTIGEKYLTMGLRKNSLFKTALSKKIGQMKYFGLNNKKKVPASYKKKTCDVDYQQYNGLHEISLQDFEGPFYLLLCGIAFSLIILAAETVYNKMEN